MLPIPNSNSKVDNRSRNNNKQRRRRLNKTSHSNNNNKVKTSNNSRRRVERTERLTLVSADAVGSRVGLTHLGTGGCDFVELVSL